MAIASSPSQSKALSSSMTLEEYLDHQGSSDIRYELVEGRLIEVGAENPLTPLITSFLFAVFLGMGLSYSQVVIGHQLEVASKQATARQPDLIVHTAKSKAAILKDGKVLRAGSPAPMLVVEVVSNSQKDQQSYQRDHVEKPVEYAALGIPEYWIIDPDRAVVKIGSLVDGVYQFADFVEGAALISSSFPQLELLAAQVLNAGEA